MATISTNTPNNIPGINWSYVDAARFEPSYGFLPETKLPQSYDEDRLNGENWRLEPIYKTSSFVNAQGGGNDPENFYSKMFH